MLITIRKWDADGFFFWKTLEIAKDGSVHACHLNHYLRTFRLQIAQKKIFLAFFCILSGDK